MEEEKGNTLKRSADDALVPAETGNSNEGEPQKKRRKRSSYFRVLKSSSPSPSATPRAIPRVTPKSALKSVSFNLPYNDDDSNNGKDDEGSLNNNKEKTQDESSAPISERSFLDVVGIHTPVARRMSRAEALRETLDEMDATIATAVPAAAPPVRSLKFGEDEDSEGMDVSTENTLQQEWAVKTTLRFYSAASHGWAVPTEQDRTLALAHANDSDLPQGTGSPAACIAHAVQCFVLRNNNNSAAEAKDGGSFLEALSSLYALEAAGTLPYFYVLGESFTMLIRDTHAYVHPPTILRAFASKMNNTTQGNKNNENVSSNDKDNNVHNENDEENEDESDDDDDEDTVSPLKYNRRKKGTKKATKEERELEALRENSGGFVPVRMPGDLTIEEVLAMAAESAARPPEVVQDAAAVRALFEGLAASSLAARAVVLAPRAFPGGALQRGAVRTYPVHRKTGPGVFEDVSALEVTGYVFNDRFRRIVGVLKHGNPDNSDGRAVDESFSADVEIVQPTAYFNTHVASYSSSPQPTTPGKKAAASVSAGLYVSKLKWSKAHGSLSYTLTKK